MNWFFTIHLGWDYTLAEHYWLDSGFAPAGPINRFTYIRPSIQFHWSW